MSALPIDASVAANHGMNLEFVSRVMGKREAKRLEALLFDCEPAARKLIDEGIRAAEEVFAHARAEALEIINAVPNFAEMQARPYGAAVVRAIRHSADRYGISMGAVTGRAKDQLAAKARHDAIVEIIKARPTLSNASIAHLFSGISISLVRQIRNGGEG